MSNAADMSGHEGFEKTAEDKTNVQGDDRKPSRRNRGGVRGQQPVPSSKFKGKCDDIADFVFDIGLPSSTQDMFSTVLKEIAEYVGRSYEKAGDLRNCLIEMDIPDIQEPTEPDANASIGKTKMYELQLKVYVEKTIRREEQLQRIFALILGQCSQTLRDRLEAGPSWKKINADSDVIGLLKNIRSQLHEGECTATVPGVSFLQAERALSSFTQGRHMRNTDFMKKLRSLMDVFEAAGGHIGRTASSFLKNSSSPPSSSEVEEARSLAREEYGALAMITRSDPRRYQELINQLHNNNLSGHDGYPKTMAQALDMLNNFRGSNRVYPEHEVAFTAHDHNGNNRSNTRGGHGGRGGRGGRGHGRREDGNNNDGGTQVDVEASSTNKSSTKSASYTAFSMMACEWFDSLTEPAMTASQFMNMLPAIWLLLDSCSTVDIISDKTLLHNIHTAEHPIDVYCNAGKVTLTQQGYLGDYPQPVWYNPNGIANILSLNNVIKYFHVTMDTSRDNGIYVHRSDGSTIHFEPSHRGVYKHEITSTSINNLWDFTLINTVADCAEKYTPQELTRAKEARRLQNIIMRPGSRYFKDMAIQHLHGCPITSRDVTIADNVYGPNLGSLKGKTTRRPVPSVSNRNDPVPPPILATHNHLGLSTDIFFINKMTFLSTYSRDLRFRTVVTLANRQLPHVRDHLQATLRLYHSRGFRISAIYADPEFEGLRAWFPQLETCGADDHIGDVERSIRTIKDRVRSTYRMLPFRQIPRIILGHLVRNVVFWLNSFPSGTGPTTHHSPAYLMTGRQVTYKAHAQLEFGEYVQTHEEHSNDMRERTAGAICLGPTGNAQGTHFFMSLATGSLIRRTRWTRLPMPIEVIHRVNQLGRAQNMPQNLAFGDRHGVEIGDDLDDIVDDPNDDDFTPLDPATADDTLFYDDDLSAAELGHPEFPDDPSFTDLHSVSSQDDDSVVSDPETTGVRMETDNHPENTGVRMETDNGSCDGDNYIDEDDDDSNNTESTGVEDTRSCENTGVEDTRSIDDESSGADDDEPSNMCDEIRLAEEAGRIAAINDEQLPKRTRKPNSKHMNMMNMVAEYIHTTFEDMEPEVIFTLLAGKDMQSQLTLLTTQMSAKAGLKQFGQAGADAIMKELEQLLYRKVMQGKRANTLTRDQKKAALHYLMFLKQKRCGKIKARGCADGRKQRLYKTKEESSPTVSIEGLFLTCIIDVLEKRDVATVDIPGAFMQADIDELIHVKLEGETAILLVRIDPTYQQFLTYENGKPVIYAELTKALYGTVQAAMLFWKNLTNFLVNELGFVINPYDFCVANKDIDGKQCTIAWHVDDLKISHASSKVVDSIIHSLSDRYGKETPLSVTRGKVHEYLGMTIDFSNTEFVQFYMHDFVNGILEETPAELLKGIPTTPAATHLFDIDDNAEKLDSEQAITFHHLVAKLLYLCKRARPDLQLAVAFLTTRVQSPDVDDWKKLGRCLTYLRETKDEKLTLGADDLGVIKWWIDASFAVHKDYKSHTGATMSLGRGHPISMSSKQKINTRSSTEAELVGVNDAMSLVLWVRMFLLEQGFEVKDNVIFQDNQSTILLARNGRQSSGKKTRHIEIRYYFITDNISRGTCSVKYCPTEQMIADFFTKPLQGSLFRWMRDKILGKHHIGVTDSQECVGAGASMPTTNEDLGDVDVTHALMVEDEGFFRLDEEKESAQQVKEKEFSHTHQCRSYSDVVKSRSFPQRSYQHF